MLACIKRANRPVSEVARKFEPVPQLLKNVRFTGGKPLENTAVKDAIEDARSRLGSAGRLVIRPSGTEPLIRVMAEGDDETLVETVVNDIVGVITELRQDGRLTMTHARIPLRNNRRRPRRFVRRCCGPFCAHLQPQRALKSIRFVVKEQG